MRFRVLGQIEAWDGDRQVPLGTPKQRVVLATLLVHTNEAVSVDRLIEALWDQEPPPTARASLQVYVSRLRTALQQGSAERGDRRDQLLVGHPHGYLLRVGPEQLDLLRFEELVALGRQALTQNDPERAAQILREALRLWSGPALSGVPSEWLRRVVAPRLDEARLTALELRVEADLACGRHAELVGELTSLTVEHPLREQLHEHMMLSLYRAGRQADALAAYRALRRRLVEELGVEPARSLQDLQRRMLEGDPAIDPPAGPVAAPVKRRDRPGTSSPPHQLPSDVASFIGRQRELARLDQVLAATTQPGPVVISAIDGAGGIGKSALAIHAAHRLADRFPDGQLYVNLQGSTAGLAPLEPLEVLGRFLRALGVEGSRIPAGLDEAAARFRSEVATRRLLVVLDNARDAPQVAPLLPGTSSCEVIVTSRQVLATLGDATHVHLDVLSPEEAIELLGRLADERQVAAEPEAVAEVARWCGHLPLALRIAAARLAARPRWHFTALAERLADAKRRLDELEFAEVGVRASLAVSYELLQHSADPLDRAAAEAFPLLGLLDGPDIGVPAAARLLDRAQDAAEQVLERLADAQLLETQAPGRYRMHDLLRMYAREQAARQHSEPDHAAALTRVFGLYVATAWHTLSLINPGDPRLRLADERWQGHGLRFPDDAAALAWLETERGNLIAAVAQAAITLSVPAAVSPQLAHALAGFLQARNYWRDWLHVNNTALPAARRAADLPAQAQIHNDLGNANFWFGRFPEALAALHESLTINQRSGDRRGQAQNLNNLSLVYERQGRYDEAVACLQESLAIKRDLGDRRGEAGSLKNLGRIYHQQDRHAQALVCFKESLALDLQLGDRRGQALSLDGIGLGYARQGRYAEALTCLHESLPIFEEIGGRNEQAEVLKDLSILYAEQSRYEEALDCQHKSLLIFRDVGNEYSEAEVLRELGSTLQAAGRCAEARAHWRQALTIFERLQTADADAVRAIIASGEKTPASRPT